MIPAQNYVAITGGNQVAFNPFVQIFYATKMEADLNKRRLETNHGDT